MPPTCLKVRPPGKLGIGWATFSNLRHTAMPPPPPRRPFWGPLVFFSDLSQPRCIWSWCWSASSSNLEQWYQRNTIGNCSFLNAFLYCLTSLLLCPMSRSCTIYLFLSAWFNKLHANPWNAFLLHFLLSLVISVIVSVTNPGLLSFLFCYF